MARISVRTDEKLKEEFERFCDRNGTSMSGELKRHMERVTGHKSHDPLPEEPELAKAYRRLYEIQSSDGRVTVSDAEPQVANILSIPAKTVRRRVFRELDERGYINVKVGIITVNVDLDQPAAPTAEGSGSPEVPADD